MSGRGKGGKGLGAGTAKKQKTNDDAEADAHKWQDGDGVVVISYANNQDTEVLIYCIPETCVHALLKPAIKAQDPTELYIIFGDCSLDNNDNIFNSLNNKDVQMWKNGDDGGEEDDEDDKDDENDENDGELDDDEKNEVIETISTWIATLDTWRTSPQTAVKITARVSVYEEL